MDRVVYTHSHAHKIYLREKDTLLMLAKCAPGSLQKYTKVRKRPYELYVKISLLDEQQSGWVMYKQVCMLLTDDELWQARREDGINQIKSTKNMQALSFNAPARFVQSNDHLLHLFVLSFLTLVIRDKVI
jgi:hypothetical protein